ncbi:MAG TPA: DNA-3-methyladenine glycosylase [Actinomycetota bacterium]|nr:DNA-3-methyladenine glycosylase [Actinomycetota bacterium]
MGALSRRFYGRDPLLVAPDLIGRLLVSDLPAGRVSGRIVEVEAYCGPADPASHAYRGRTPRNAVMFGPPGHLYVYFSYGMHHCANVVCEAEASPGAVLLRAVEPVDGIALMRERRGGGADRLLCRGPGRLAQAFGIDLALNGADLVAGPVSVRGPARVSGTVAASRRIGISKATEELWRFYEPGPWASPMR